MNPTLAFSMLDTTLTPPSYALGNAAGIDLPCRIDTTILAQGRATLPTGIAVAIPSGHVGLIWDRSGLASRQGLHCLAGVIDQDYRGEIRVVIVNLGNEPYSIKKGDRIAQLLIQPITRCTLIHSEQLDQTSRGERGFGSTDTL